MKKIFNILVYVGLIVLAVACTKSNDENLLMGQDEGVVSLNLDLGDSRAASANNAIFSLKIYRYTSDGSTGERTKELVRKYMSLSEVPQYIWLLKDDYNVVVKVGEQVVASFDELCYTGTADFTITPGDITKIDVKCKMDNIAAKVSFDATVAAHFTEDFYVYVSAANEFDLNAAKASKVPTLKYTESATGYFLMPDGCTTLSWYFYGTDGVTPVTQTGKIENITAQTLYTLGFKYSKDANGYLVISATVDTSVEHRDDKIAFSPDPTVKGIGFDVATPYNYAGGTRSYSVTALDTISQLNITTDNLTFDLLNSTYDGITVTKVSAKEYKLDLAEQFFANFAGGNQTFAFRIKDASGGVGFTEATYGIQGVLPISAGDYDLWFNTAFFEAMSFNANAATKIGYRIAGGSWSYLSASAGSVASIYNATATDFAAGRTYEYALFANDVQVGKALSINTPAGAQIPEADFEHWSTHSDGAACPGANANALIWDTGNHATASLSLGNLTTSSTDVPSSSTGSYSAYMKSMKAQVFGIGKFAAGNLFVGNFVQISGMGGIVAFGKPFEYTARPKALRFWMKNYCGTINEGSHTSGTDLAKVYITLSNITEPYIVNTNDESTLFDPKTANGVVAYGVWESTESKSVWTKMEIPLTYKDETTKPNYIIATFSCSGYGDYFTGSTDSYMYVDDVELVY